MDMHNKKQTQENLEQQRHKKYLVRKMKQIETNSINAFKEKNSKLSTKQCKVFSSRNRRSAYIASIPNGYTDSFPCKVQTNRNHIPSVTHRKVSFDR